MRKKKSCRSWQDSYILSLIFNSTVTHIKFLPLPTKVKVKIKICVRIISHHFCNFGNKCTDIFQTTKQIVTFLTLLHEKYNYLVYYRCKKRTDRYRQNPSHKQALGYSPPYGRQAFGCSNSDNCTCYCMSSTYRNF